MYKFIKDYKLLIVIIFSFSLFSLIFIKSSRAEDLIIVCDSVGCSSPLIPLFNSPKILPGELFEKSFKVVNSRAKDIDLVLSSSKNSETDEMLLDVLDVSIRNKDNSIIRNLSLFEFLSSTTSTSLGIIPAGLDREYKILISFRPNTNNEYQGKKAKFDIFINVSGDDENSLETISGLNSSQPVLSEIGGVVAGISTIPRRIRGAILGATTEDIGEELAATNTPMVAGISCVDEYYYWWIPLIVEALLFLLLLYISKRNNLKFKYFVLYSFVFTTLSQLIHQKLGCNCATDIWCSKYWIINLLILLVSLLLLRLIQKRKLFLIK